MKQKDLVLVLAVAGFSAVVALLLSNLFLANPKNRQEKVQIVEAISSDFKIPAHDDKYFNDQAINPTATVKIGDTNNKPFN